MLYDEHTLFIDAYRLHLTCLSLVALKLIASAPRAISKRDFRLSLVNRFDSRAVFP